MLLKLGCLRIVLYFMPAPSLFAFSIALAEKPAYFLSIPFALSKTAPVDLLNPESSLSEEPKPEVDLPSSTALIFA